ncbi:MAG: 2-isopropylmalate synthase, partial [Lentisphaerae bacterium]
MKSKKTDQFVEVMDTTLRDGEQTPGVAFTPAEKLEIARLLLTRVKVDRLEIASARVSEGEKEAVRAILAWAEHRGCLEQMEILSFVDNHASVDWIKSVGGKVINMLAKGSEEHCRVQLKKTPARHFDDVAAEIEYAHSQGLMVNLYLEDWSNGMRNSFGYVYEFLNRIKDLPVERVMLPDTLGVLEPTEVTTYIEWLYRGFPHLRLDFHGHNDYGVVTANSLAAVRAGVNGI